MRYLMIITLVPPHSLFHFIVLLCLEFIDGWQIMIPLSIVTKPQVCPIPNCDIYLLWHLLVTVGTIALGKANPFQSTLFHLFSIWLANSLSSVVSAFLAYKRYWLNMKAWCHIFAGKTFFYILICQCGVFRCRSLSWHWVAFWFTSERLAHSWRYSLFCLKFLEHIWTSDSLMTKISI